MKAIVWTEYGSPDGLELRELPAPRPRRGELLVRVLATSVTAGDTELRALRVPLGMRILVRLIMGPVRPRPRVLGQEFAGEVVEVGQGATRFRPGDRVSGTTGFRFGAYAEYLRVPEISSDGAVSVHPTRMTSGEAATVPTGALEALHFLRTAGNLAGSRVLIIGAGGGIGLMAVQLTHHFGGLVTAVESPHRLDLPRALGVEHVIDHTRNDFAASGEIYDIVFDTVGVGQHSRALRVLRPGGTYLVVNPSLRTVLRRGFSFRSGHKRVVVRGPRPTIADLDFLRGLIEAGHLRAVVDREYPLERLADAHRYVDAGLARGRVVIVVGDRDRPIPPTFENGSTRASSVGPPDSASPRSG